MLVEIAVPDIPASHVPSFAVARDAQPHERAPRVHAGVGSGA